ncbi:MAG: DUF2786 domain-containing protein [Candidatus Binataceae bacterium]
MKIEDALRKIQLLRRVKPEAGASQAEAENAANLERALMNRFSLAPQNVRLARPPQTRLTWVYWEMLLDEFGIRLRRFGKRGSASLIGDRTVYISLATGEWRVQKMSAGGWERVDHGWGVESFRAYLSKSNPRTTFMFGRK